ncbi:class I SAM-dependent methyltransferase [Nocardioides sp. InS609-2]|uniref:class I SAM-dependent methyltransferase n=1 Tax=Nocardioides sp. InS609-2 TaxID=2760705 RepID=UPI0020BF889E|nr:class I SAM-dependent methyltransferase [Nocardioides sp. InS609-2]
MDKAGSHTHRNTSSTPEFWDAHYSGLDLDWGRRPNAALVDVLAELAPEPGRVLDLGAGHGGDSLWLAANGWTVTAVDVSATALGRMADAVDEAGLTQRVSMQQHDLTATFPEGQFDLVTATYFQSPVAMDRPAVLRRSADAITPGGRLVVIDHASAPSWSTHGTASFPTAAQTLDEIGLDSRVWHTELCVRRDREATGHNGKTGTLADNVLVLRKDR